jgi:hypothetical protein
MTIFLAILGTAILIGLGVFLYLKRAREDNRIIFQNLPPPPPPAEITIQMPKPDNSWEGIAKGATRSVLGIGIGRLDKLANPT